MLFDIDDFKAINDRYGHDVGDSVLSAVAETVQSSLRDTDVFGRWGGEEFVILMPETSLESAVAAAERLREAVAGRQFEKVGKVTVSMGVAEKTKDDDSIHSVIKRADEAMYRAKAEGKNRVRAG